MNKKTRFVLFFGNRSLFPPTMIADARRELAGELNRLGHEVLLLDEEATRFGAVETTREGQVFADFLDSRRGEFEGVILCLPNFGDETGAVAALKEAKVPILLQAYPDEMDQMAPSKRRDAFCGKISIADVFRQHDIKFTALQPHVVRPTDPRFTEQIDHFDRLCRVVNGMQNMVVGAIGARTTPFKTVRIDELALQSHGITVETMDMAQVIGRVNALDSQTHNYGQKAAMFRDYTTWDGIPEPAFENIVKLALVMDEIIDEFELDAFAIRCWLELQEQLGISPCVMVGALNNLGIGAACEVDIGSAITMRALHLASGEPPACLDWNNNYGDEEEKCILFHCGPVPKDLMAGPSRISDHDILINAIGEGHSYGCHIGRIKPMDFTFGNLMTEAGNLNWYFGEGRLTSDPVPDDFFGVAGVAEVPNLQAVLMYVLRSGHRHHVNLAPGRYAPVLSEAMEYYLAQNVQLPQEGMANEPVRY